MCCVAALRLCSSAYYPTAIFLSDPWDGDDGFKEVKKKKPKSAEFSEVPRRIVRGNNWNSRAETNARRQQPKKKKRCSDNFCDDEF